ncbi:MAG: O-antigen ligase family protein [Acutalibacteraceae bacterium]
MKNFLCVLIFSTFLGSSFEIFKIGSITFNLFRVLFLIFTILHVLHTHKSGGTEPSPTAIKYQNYLKVFVIFNFLTLLQTPSFSDWINGCIFYSINIALIYYIYAYTDCREDLDKYLKTYILGIALTIIVSVYEYITGNHIISTNYFSIYSTSSWQYELLSLAPTGFLYNPNNIGVVMILGLGFGLYFVKKPIGWVFFAIWAALCVYVSFATGSRGAILLIFLAIMLSVFLGTKGTLKKGIMLFSLSMVGLLLSFIFNDFIFEQLQRAGFFRYGFSFTEDSRWELIIHCLKASRETFFLGTGPMTAETVLSNLFDIKPPVSVHNFWAEFLLTQGLFSFVCFVSFYFRCIKVQWQLRENDIVNSVILVVLIMFAFAVFIPPTVMTLYFLWLIFGFSIATEKLYYNDTGILI